MARLRRTLMLTVLVALAACGGGSSGGGPAFGPQLFVGFYDFFTMGYRFGVSAQAEVSVANPDGVGDGTTSEVIENDDGMIAAGSASAFGFTVDDAGNVALFNPAFPALTVQGGISADGQCVVLGGTDFDTTPGFLAMLRNGTGFSNASLSGGFHFGYFFSSVTSIGAGWGMATLNGDGTWAVDAIDENDTTSIALGGPIAGLTYSVVASGRTTMDFVGYDLRGMLCNGGAYGMLGGDVLPVGGSDLGPLCLVLIRKGSGLNSTTLSGSYWIAGGGYTTGGVTKSFFGLANANGAGGLTADVKANDDGVVSDPPADAGNGYTVGADGTLTVTTSDGNTLRGGVSADGRFAFAAGGITDPSDVQFVLFCRKN